MAFYFSIGGWAFTCLIRRYDCCDDRVVLFGAWVTKGYVKRYGIEYSGGCDGRLRWIGM